MLMDIDDAQKWCSSPLSCGVIHGNRWAYFYTSLKNYASHYGLKERGVILQDNGSWDEKIRRAGAKKKTLQEIQGIAARCGISIEVKGAKAKERRGETTVQAA
jgi:hypothetical protein